VINKKKAKGLDLSKNLNAKDNKKLTELPESIGQLTQLQSLDLSRNQLTALPEWLGQLILTGCSVTLPPQDPPSL
jgi:Leucine-rich repeat (LRR) protein